MIALLSNGITSEPLKKALSGYFVTLSIAAVVVTADNEYKEQNYHVPRIINELKEYGLRVDIFDLDKQNATELLRYDAVEFIGGNPYYLLNSIRVHKASSVIKQLAEEKVLLGYSAGAMVFTPSIEIVDKLTPEINIINLKNFNALALTNTHILPHYSKFERRFDKLENICNVYEQEHNCSIVKLNDGDGIITDNGIEKIILNSYKTESKTLFQKSCGAVVFRKNNGIIEYLCLFQRRSQTYSVPKGHMEAFETEKETAQREIKEEIGISVDFVQGFREIMQYEIADGKFKTVVLFLAECQENITTDEKEIEKYEWLSSEKAKAILPYWYTPIIDKTENLLKQKGVCFNA